MIAKEMENDEIGKEEDINVSLSPRINQNPSAYQRSKTPNTKYNTDKEIKITVIKTPKKKDNTTFDVESLIDVVFSETAD